MDKLLDNSTQENGSATAVIITSIVSIVILIFVITYFMWLIGRKEKESFILLHQKEEKAAYQFTWVKNQLNQMQLKCAEKAAKVEGWSKWHQNAKLPNKPPLEYFVVGDCNIDTPKFVSEE